MSILRSPSRREGIRSIVYLTLSFDHRIIDGAVADQFLAHVKNTLETWEEPIL